MHRTIGLHQTPNSNPHPNPNHSPLVRQPRQPVGLQPTRYSPIVLSVTGLVSICYVLMVINMYSMVKVMIKISQSSAVTQTLLGGQTIYPPVANFLQCTGTKRYESRLAVDKVIARIIKLVLFWVHPVYVICFKILYHNYKKG